MAKLTHRNGPALGEAVQVQGLGLEIPHLTPRAEAAEAIDVVNAAGEVVAIDWKRETFTVQLAHGVRPLVLTLEVPLAEYGRTVIGRWTCGHGNESMCCYLTAEHLGPHLYKPTP